MPAKNNSPKKINKTAFVLRFATDLPAKEIVAKAKASGFSITEKHVYAIRSVARNKSGGSQSKRNGASTSLSRANASGKKNGAKQPITKTAFILGLPSLSAKEIVMKGKEAGISLSDAHVYAVRSTAKQKAGKTANDKTSSHDGKTSSHNGKASSYDGKTSRHNDKTSSHNGKASSHNGDGKPATGKSPAKRYSGAVAEDLLRAVGAMIGLERAIGILNAER